MGIIVTPGPDKIIDMRIAHLNMIQGVIARMSGFSANAKNFCITIIAAIIAVAFDKDVPLLGYGAATIIMVFALMDTYYLSLERRFRNLYERSATAPADKAVNMSLVPSKWTWQCFGSSLASFSILPFYGLLLAAMAIMLYISAHVRSDEPEAEPISTRSPHGAEQYAVRPAVVSGGKGTNGTASPDAAACANKLSSKPNDSCAASNAAPVVRAVGVVGGK